jgi:hypothetical protein
MYDARAIDHTDSESAAAQFTREVEVVDASTSSADSAVRQTSAYAQVELVCGPVDYSHRIFETA